MKELNNVLLFALLDIMAILVYAELTVLLQLLRYLQMILQIYVYRIVRTAHMVILKL